MDASEIVGLVIAACAAIGVVTAGSVAAFNYRNVVRWKRAELASEHLRALTLNDELEFATRALDWQGGLLVVPRALRPLLAASARREVIEHDPAVLARAMATDLSLAEMEADPRLQVYRTAMDSFLTWHQLARKALARNLYAPADIEQIAYWLLRIQQAQYLEPFMRAFGYLHDIRALERIFAREIAEVAAR
jgi:hypothetical protein